MAGVDMLAQTFAPRPPAMGNQSWNRPQYLALQPLAVLAFCTRFPRVHL